MSKRKGGSDIRQFFGQPQKRKKVKRERERENVSMATGQGECVLSKEREGERECEHGDRTGRVCTGDMEIIPSSRESEFDNERESSQAGENEGTGKEGEELGLCPNHPNVKVIPSQTLSNRILYFQEKWFKDHTWLHYSPSVKGVLCFYCAKYFAAQKSKLASKADSAFVKTGFNNWKKALEKCSVHKDSQCHKLAVMTRIQEPEPVNVQLSRELERRQQQARRNLMKIAGGVRYLARQGLAFRGDQKESGNLSQLLKYKATGDAELTSWLKGPLDFTSPELQNELLKLMANTIIK
ncbi:hypothetical protein F7725_007563 [Dissostichus mawsoni]|uniref:TTF-type domain-containing protein n=1 Tax=Dissostichus mawsoni TaxID=36200 RepID=A0A7J5Y4U2_DISMA|nr:hypothetical protein F7725_007563 [Dissostichus mawsoni]